MSTENVINNDSSLSKTVKTTSVVLIMVCIYIFLYIERPWETIRYLQNIPIERVYAICMIFIVFLHHKFKIVSSPTNKWVYGLLALHFILSPFAFSPSDAYDQSIEYAKMTVLYLLMLSVADDEESLRMLVKVFVFSMLFYISHSLWEYHNGRHQVRMGISRMVGADYSDPNGFGASVVLSLPFVYALLRTETKVSHRKWYYLYVILAVVCVVLTGSRSAFVALMFLLMLWIIVQQGKRRIKMLVAATVAVSALWVVMPAEKQERIRTLWDEEAGPENAHGSAKGRLNGWRVSWVMFKQRPFTGVGVGGKNFIGYRVAKSIDQIAHPEEDYVPNEQSHVLYGQVLAEQGLFGAMLFVGLVASIVHTAFISRSRVALVPGVNNFSYMLSGAIIVAVLLLLLLGFGGHNFYRPLWLWLAAWSGGIAALVKRQQLQPIHGSN